MTRHLRIAAALLPDMGGGGPVSSLAGAPARDSGAPASLQDVSWWSGWTWLEQAIWEAVVILGLVTALLYGQWYFRRGRHRRGRP